MALHYENLDEKTRSYMLNEVNLDLSQNNIYMSQRLNELGSEKYVSLLIEAITHHNDAWLAQQLRIQNYMKDREPRGKVPVNAPDILSEGEFNRYYMRGLCARVIEENKGQVEVYRGKQVNQPRPESKAMIGKKFTAEKLLEDLRESIGIDTVLGLPPGPNSGLTICMVEI